VNRSPAQSDFGLPFLTQLQRRDSARFGIRGVNTSYSSDTLHEPFPPGGQPRPMLRCEAGLHAPFRDAAPGERMNTLRRGRLRVIVLPTAARPLTQGSFPAPRNASQRWRNEV
jgi:hypothetical protein